MTPIKKTVSAPLSVLSAAFLWGFIGISVRPLAALGLTAIDLTFLRSAAAFIAVLLMILVSDASRLDIRMRDSWIFLGSGIMSIVFFNVCYFVTQQIMPLSLSSIFLYTAPFFVVILSALIFREPLTRVKLAALLTAFCGCIFASGAFGGSSVRLNGVGVTIGLCSGLGYGLYSIFGRIAMKRYSSLTFMLYTFFTAAVTLLPFADIRRIASVCAGGGGIYLLLFSVVFTIIPYILYTVGLGKMSAGSASVLAYAEPMTAAVVGFIFFGEKLTALSVLGIAMIFLAVVCLIPRDRE